MRSFVARHWSGTRIVAERADDPLVTAPARVRMSGVKFLITLAREAGLTPEQVEEHDLDRLAIQVKPSDGRSVTYIEEYGRRCWEADILPADVIERAINVEVMRGSKRNCGTAAAPRSSAPASSCNAAGTQTFYCVPRELKKARFLLVFLRVFARHAACRLSTRPLRAALRSSVSMW